jgi:hypothetical protein
MKDDYEQWEAGHRAGTEGLAHELRRERRELEDRLRRLDG